MVVRHIAWFRFREGVSPDRIESHMAACRALAGRVPALIALECGANFTDRAGGMTHGIIATVASRAKLAEYISDPVHVPVADALKADLADLRVMDIEV